MPLCSLQSAVEASFCQSPLVHPTAVTPIPRQSRAVPASPAMVPPPFAPRPSSPDIGSSQLLDQVSVRGITVTLADVARVAPVLTFHPKERHFPCAIDALLAGACLLGADGQALKANPTSLDLGRHASAGNRLCLSDHHAAGGPAPGNHEITAPMYVAVQVPKNRAHVDIRYLFLFGYQGAQVVRLMVPGNDFNSFLPHFGEHQGDIESVCVRLTPDLQRITHVTFEQHGKPEMIPAQRVMLTDGHPLVRCALEDHATYNAYGLEAEARIEHTEETRQPIPGFGVAFIDLVSSNGALWAPHALEQKQASSFVFVGLDKCGQPINQQAWTGFAGTIGARRRNDFAGAQGIDKPLSFLQRTFVDSVVKAVVASGKLEEKRRTSDGTPGLGGRSWLPMEV